MLYHVPDVSRAVFELARILRPGGRLVAVTNRSDHLRELSDLLGAESVSAFDDDSGPRLLAQHFAHVEERDAGGWINFPNREAVQAYVDATRTFWTHALPDDFQGSLRVRRSPVIYVATA
jgi:SAM-dependent methyltransferase